MVVRKTLTLITGADKGVGFETAKQLGKSGQQILLGSRSLERGAASVASLAAEGVQAQLIQLDVTDHDSIQQAADKIAHDYGYLDILINNAGMTNDAHQAPSTLPIKTMRAEFDVNFFGLVETTQMMLPLLKKGHQAKIINLSSNMGSLSLASDPDSRFYQVSSLGYQASKAAVNFATICFSKELTAEGITVNSVNPGWTATGFGGRELAAPKPEGMQSVAAGAARVVALAQAKTNQVTGTFTENEGTLPW